MAESSMTITNMIDDIPQKSIEDSFRDWESDVFGFGYGSGEEPVLTALKGFIACLYDSKDARSYDYAKLETVLTPAVTWLLINALCHADIIEYGTSPRFGWLTRKGERLRDFIGSHTIDELVEICCNHDENYSSCSPDSCNCGEHGYVEGRKCPNPFWGKD